MTKEGRNEREVWADKSRFGLTRGLNGNRPLEMIHTVILSEASRSRRILEE